MYSLLYTTLRVRSYVITLLHVQLAIRPSSRSELGGMAHCTVIADCCQIPMYFASSLDNMVG